MRIHPMALMNDEDQEASWAFNDINLTMVIIMLFYAVLFASLISTTTQIQQETTSSDIEKENPVDLSSLDHYGHIGFPQAQEIKGFPSKETFNDDLIVTENEAIRDGIFGDMVWNFDELDNLREKKIIQINVDRDGTLTYEGWVTSLQELQALIDDLSSEHHVFIEVHIDKEAPMGVYDRVRSFLWNDSDAVHWKFTTR